MASLKVKICTHCTSDIKPYNESQINSWLEGQGEIQIVHLLQSESMVAVDSEKMARNLTITLFYTRVDDALEEGEEL